MKKALIFMLLLSSAAQAKEFRFIYILGHDRLEYKTDADSWEQAFRRGASFCFDFFAKTEHLTENRGLDIIDSCANPR